MKKISASILSAIMMLSMIFSSSVFAANDQTQTSAWDSFVGLFTKATTAGTMGVEYNGWVQDVGQTPTDGSYITGPDQLGTPGLSRRLEGVQIKLTGTIPTGASIKYIVHVQNYGWMGDVNDTTTWKSNGTYAGTKDEALRIEDIKIMLVGADGKQLPGYSVSYAGHVENEGDLAWVSDGASFNNTGKSQRLECLKVKITQTKADMTAYNAAVAQANSAKAADYTTASYKALTDAVAANVVTDADTQAKVDAAAAAINAAYAALVPAANLTDYTAAVTKANAVVAADYTADSYAALTKALADNVVTKDDTQAKVDAATAAINGAYDALVPALNVTSVNTDNLRTMIVTFNKPVDKTTVTTTTTKLYLGTSTTADVYVAQWNTEATELQLAYSSTQSQDTDAKLVMSGVKSTDGLTLADYSQTFAIKDTKSPAAQTAKVVTSKQLEIQFSEPMSATGVTNPTLQASRAQFKVDGTNLTTTYINDAYGKVTLNLLNKLSVGKHELVVSGLRDFAGFTMASKTFEIEVIADTTAPAISSASFLDGQLLQVTFSKPIDSLGTIKVGATTTGASDNTITSGPVTISGYTLETTTGVTADELSVSKYLKSTDGLTYTFRLPTGNIVQQLGLVDGVGIQYVNLQDAEGNKVTTAAHLYAPVVSDTSKPTVKSVQVIGATDATAGVVKNDVLVTFDKPMLTVPSTFEIRDANNALVPTGSVAFRSNSATVPYQNQILISAATTGFNSTNGGTYTVNIKGAKDNTVRQNTMDDFTTPITVLDTKAPAVSSFKATLTTNASTASTTTPDIITVTFPEAMDSATIADPNNYQFKYSNADTSYTILANKAGYISITPAADNKSVVIKLAQDVTATQAGFKFLGIKDGSGNVNTDYATVVTVAAVPSAQLNQSNVTTELIANNQLKVSLNAATIAAGEQFATIDPNEFKVAYKVSDAGTVDTLYAYGTSLASQTATEAVINLSAAVGADGKVYATARNTAKVVVEAAGTLSAGTTVNTKDQYGNVLYITAANAVTPADKIAPTLTSVLQADSTIAVGTAGNAQIVLAYDEAMTDNSGSFIYDIAVTDVTTGTVLTPTTDFTIAQSTVAGSVGLSNNAYTITVIKNGVVGHAFAVSYEDSRYVTDAATALNQAAVLSATNVLKSDASGSTAAITERTKPGTGVTSATYTASTDTFVITGTNFGGTTSAFLAPIGTEVRGYLDWSKFVYNADPSGTVAHVTFTASDIVSATPLSGTTMQIVLTPEKAAALESTTGFDTSDTITTTAGFTIDQAGNLSTTDNAASAAVTVN
jgi:hypothetical protein